MNLYAKIITDDKRFERMLALELSDRGVDVLEGVKEEARTVSKKNFFTILDLDFCSESDFADLIPYSNVIGFSQKYQDMNNDTLHLCYAVLHRPFLMDELFSVIFGDGKQPLMHKSSQPTKTENAQIRDKKRYLKVDHASKKAVWGNDGISLTDSEYRVLSLLCDRRGETVTRPEISELLGASDGNICDVYICMLRRKIDNRLGVKLIYTVRGKGYILKN